MQHIELPRHSVVHQLATGISHVFCPPCVATGGILFAAAAQPSPQGWCYAGIYIVCAILVPVLTLYWLMGQGQVTDLDVSRREERHKPFIAALCGATTAYGVLHALEAPSLLVHFAAAHTIVMGVVCVVTFSWKISVHAAGATAVTTLVVTLLGAHTVVLLPMLLVAWSRLYLKRHTLSQVIAGALLGALVFAALL